MSCFNDMWFRVTGYAYHKGLDYFEETMPREKALSLYRGCQEAHGFKWVEDKFVDMLIATSAREHRRLDLFPPECKDGCECKYRIRKEQDSLQRNALRIESGWSCQYDKCCQTWMTMPFRRFGRIGSYPRCDYPLSDYQWGVLIENRYREQQEEAK